MDKETIARNFSRYAHFYDKYADVQRMVAGELLQKTQKDNLARILELGCGTGNYTLLLRKRFKKARIKAVDICEEMIRVAREKLKGKDVDFVVADAETLSLNERFDFVTSNACFHWFEDLEKALLKYKSILKEGGSISFSFFGPQTFQELNSSIKSVLGNTSIAVDGFMSRERVERILKENFKGIKIKEIRYKENLASLKDLLDKIKYTGTRGNGLEKKIYFSRRTLREIDAAYSGKLKKITATYQVFFCQGRI